MSQHARVIRRIGIFQYDGSVDGTACRIGFEDNDTPCAIGRSRTEIRLIDLSIDRRPETRRRHHGNRIGRPERKVVFITSAIGIDRESVGRDLDPVSGIGRLADMEGDRHRMSGIERIGKRSRRFSVAVGTSVIRSSRDNQRRIAVGS